MDLQRSKHLIDVFNKVSPQNSGLYQSVVEGIEFLSILKVAVNDKVSDPGATAMINQKLAKIDRELERLGYEKTNSVG